MGGRVVCIGDSITEGVGDELSIGWVGRIANKLASSNTASEPWRFINLGVAGDTSICIKHRICSEALYRTPEILIIAAGINDTAYRLWPDQRGQKIDIHNARFTWKETFNILKGQNCPILSIGPTPVDENKLPNVWRPFDDKDKGTDLKNSAIEHYNTMLKEEVELAGHHFVDMYASLDHSLFIPTLADGLHPDQHGYDQMAAVIIEALDKINMDKYSF